LPVRVTVVEGLGADAFVYGTYGVEGTPNNTIVRLSGRDTVHGGDIIHVMTDPRHVHAFETTRALASAIEASRFF
jgi:multiple sugar transport system ATP-binding protein